MTSETPKPLSTAQVGEYHLRGWVIPDWEFRPDLIADMRAEYEALLARNPDIGSDIILAPHQVSGGQWG